MKRPRFSLRGLLITTALLAGFCYWRNLPRQNAKRFVALIEAGDDAAVQTMFTKGPPRPGTNRRTVGYWIARQKPQSVADWFAGRCFVDAYRHSHGDLADRVKVSAVGVEVVDSWQSKRYWVDAFPQSRRTKYSPPGSDSIPE